MVQDLFVGIDLGASQHVMYWSDESRIEKVSTAPGVVQAWLQALVAREVRPVLLVEDPWAPLVIAALAQGVSVQSVNPFQLARYRSATSVAQAKDDKRDARTMVEFHAACPTAFRVLEAPVDAQMVLRLSVIERETVVEDLGRVRNRLSTLLATAFPAMGQLSAALDRQWLLRFLRDSPTSLDVDSVEDAKAFKRLCRALKVESDDEARALLCVNPALEEGSIADTYRDRIRWEAGCLLNLVRREAELRARLKRQLRQLAEQQDDTDVPGAIEILDSFPNLGPVILAAILVEVPELMEDVVPERETLRSRSGVRPVTRQSGGSRRVVVRRARSIRLNNALLMLAQVSRTKSPKFKARYEKLRARGKTHWTAQRITASSILDVLHAMLCQRTLYQEP